MVELPLLLPRSFQGWGGSGAGSDPPSAGPPSPDGRDRSARVSLRSPRCGHGTIHAASPSPDPARRGARLVARVVYLGLGLRAKPPRFVPPLAADARSIAAGGPNVGSSGPRGRARAMKRAIFVILTSLVIASTARAACRWVQQCDQYGNCKIVWMCDPNDNG